MLTSAVCNVAVSLVRLLVFFAYYEFVASFSYERTFGALWCTDLFFTLSFSGFFSNVSDYRIYVSLRTLSYYVYLCFIESVSDLCFSRITFLCSELRASFLPASWHTFIALRITFRLVVLLSLLRFRLFSSVSRKLLLNFYCNRSFVLSSACIRS